MEFEKPVWEKDSENCEHLMWEGLRYNLYPLMFPPARLYEFKELYYVYFAPADKVWFKGVGLEDWSKIDEADLAKGFYKSKDELKADFIEYLGFSDGLKPCDCPMNLLMIKGCQCGGI